MPLLRTPTTQELEDHFFGSGAFGFGWFSTDYSHFPAEIEEYNENEDRTVYHTVTEEDFLQAIKDYAEANPNRTYDELIEDMDAVDVDSCIQLAIFGELIYS